MAMDRRIEFDNLLKAILGSDNVYFQPPESMKLEYPCIIYNFATDDIDYADDEIYLLRHKYTIRYIALPKDFDGPTKDRITKLLKVPCTQTYASSGLYHCVYTKIY